jgi:hypothetical protein
MTSVWIKESSARDALALQMASRDASRVKRGKHQHEKLIPLWK